MSHCHFGNRFLILQVFYATHSTAKSCDFHLFRCTKTKTRRNLIFFSLRIQLIRILCASFLYFHQKTGKFSGKNQILPHTATYFFTLLYATFFSSKGVVKCGALALFAKKNYPFSTISRISLDKLAFCPHNIRIYVLSLLGQMSCASPERRRSSPQNRSAPSKNSKGCRETRLPLLQGGNFNCR